MIMKFKKSPGRFITVERAMIDEDHTLSYKAKGILTYLMGRPDDWKPNLNEIVQHATDQLGSVKSGICELQMSGYIEIVRLREKNRWIGWEWHVSDRPIYPKKSPKVKNQLTGSSKVENQLSRKPLNNKESQEFPVSRFPVFREIDFVTKKDLTKKDLNKNNNNNKEEVVVDFLNNCIKKYRISEPRIALERLVAEQQICDLKELDKALQIAHQKANPGKQVAYASKLFFQGICTASLDTCPEIPLAVSDRIAHLQGETSHV